MKRYFVRERCTQCDGIISINELSEYEFKMVLEMGKWIEIQTDDGSDYVDMPGTCKTCSP